MISICAPTFDLAGQLLLPGTLMADPPGQSRRVTRTATLDGGVSLADMGFSHGDRTVSLVARCTLGQEERARYLQRQYPLLMLAIREGVFLGAISSLSVSNGQLRMNFLVSEKLTEETDGDNS